MGAVHRIGDGTYWSAQVRAGLLLTFVLTVANSTYTLTGWERRSGAANVVLLGLNLAVLVATPITAVVIPTPRVATTDYPEPLFYVWCLGGSGAIFAGVVLDGGLASPFAWMFLVNVAMVGLVHPPRLIVFSSGLSCLGFVATAILDDAPFDVEMLVPRLVYLVAVAYLAVVTSRARWRQHDEQVKLTTALADLVERDPMTRLLNHAAFHDRLADEIARAQRRETPLSLLVVDLDHFKAVNDSHGHRTGDAAIERVANLLRVMARRGDVAARIGGEEFCLLLPHTDYPAAVAVAERLRRSVASLTEPVRVTVSIGVSTFPGVALTPDALFESADKALYEAKRAGRNRVGEIPEPPPSAG